MKLVEYVTCELTELQQSRWCLPSRDTRYFAPSLGQDGAEVLNARLWRLQVVFVHITIGSLQSTFVSPISSLASIWAAYWIKASWAIIDLEPSLRRDLIKWSARNLDFWRDSVVWRKKYSFQYFDSCLSLNSSTEMHKDLKKPAVKYYTWKQFCSWRIYNDLLLGKKHICG